MNIEWNKVTWYSKLAACIVFTLVLALGVYFGMQFQKVRDYNSLNSSKMHTTKATTGKKSHPKTVESTPGQF